MLAHPPTGPGELRAFSLISRCSCKLCGTLPTEATLVQANFGSGHTEFPPRTDTVHAGLRERVCQ